MTFSPREVQQNGGVSAFAQREGTGRSKRGKAKPKRRQQGKESPEVQGDMKLRINGLNHDITPSELKSIFKRYGKVEEVAIYASRNVVYGIITMPDPAAEKVLSSRRFYEWKSAFLTVKIANRSRGPWLSPAWRPPQEYWYR